MMKSTIAGITALSLSLAGATSAHAQGLDRDDLGKLLFGLVAVTVIGAAINNDRRENATQVHDRSRRGGNHNDNWSNRNRGHDNNGRWVLPGDCLRTVENRFGSQRMFEQRCLERHYRHANRLPERCAVRVFTSDGPRNGYDPLCLREAGYRSDRRH
jgi:hypothetical protein